GLKVRCVQVHVPALRIVLDLLDQPLLRRDRARYRRWQPPPALEQRHLDRTGDLLRALMDAAGDRALDPLEADVEGDLLFLLLQGQIGFAGTVIVSRAGHLGLAAEL